MQLCLYISTYDLSRRPIQFAVAPADGGGRHDLGRPIPYPVTVHHSENSQPRFSSKCHVSLGSFQFLPSHHKVSIAMAIAPHESHQIAVYAGQGEIVQLATLVRSLAQREDISPGQILISCKDDFQQTAAHMAAKAGHIRKSCWMFRVKRHFLTMVTGSVETLAELLSTEENKTVYFNIANRFSGDRPAHTAMRHGFLGVLRALLANGADPMAKNRFGDMVVDYLSDFEPEEVLSVIEEHVGEVVPELRTRLGLSTLRST